MSTTRNQQDVNQQTFDLNELDQDLYTDRLTRGIIRHPVAGSDGGIYEAQSYLQLLQRAGMSLINPAHRLTSATHIPALENSINQIFGDHEERHNEYNIQTVMAEIQRLLGGNAQVNHAQQDRNRVVLALGFILELSSGISAATGYFSGITMMMSIIPIANIIPVILYAAFFGGQQGIYDSASDLIHLLEKTLVISAAVFTVSKLGLFAGQKAGIFPEREQNHRHGPAMD